jgi:hypothetical protein
MRPRRPQSIFLPANKNFGDFRKIKIAIPAVELQLAFDAVRADNNAKKINTLGSPDFLDHAVF